MSLCLAVQPSVLERVGGNAELTGQGFTARMCWVVPEATGPRWLRGERPAPVPPPVKDAWHAQVTRMLQGPAGVVARLSDDARARYLSFRDELEERSQPGGDLAGDLREWTSKHWSRTARIAAVLWAADGGRGEISVQQFARAERIGRWLIGHAVRALRGTVADSREQQIIDLVRRKGSCGQRDLLRNAPKALRTSKVLLPILSDLLDRGLLTLDPGGAYRAG